MAHIHNVYDNSLYLLHVCYVYTYSMFHIDWLVYELSCAHTTSDFQVSYDLCTISSKFVIVYEQRTCTCISALPSPPAHTPTLLSMFYINKYRRPGFKCVAKWLRFRVFKVDCEFNNCVSYVQRLTTPSTRFLYWTSSTS